MSHLLLFDVPEHPVRTSADGASNRPAPVLIARSLIHLQRPGVGSEEKFLGPAG